jgi:DNA polymerase (family 10)
MKNREVSDIFNAMADVLELMDENVFKVRAYRRAAMNIDNLSEDVAIVASEGRLEEIQGIGKDLEAKILEIIKTGKCAHYEELKQAVPGVMLELVTIPGVGPKTARLLYEELGVKNIAELEMMAKRHRISGLPGIKRKTEENILKGILLVKKRSDLMTLKEATDLADAIVAGLKGVSGVKDIIPAGSLRRMKDTVRDIDILVTSTSPGNVIDAFVKLPMVKDITASGDTKASIVTHEGVQADLRVVDPESLGAASVYFTGSQAHNIKLRHIAKLMDQKVNEYGVFSNKTGKLIAGRTEADVYKALKLDYIEPELREDRGEVEAARNGDLPDLINIEDIRGDLHVHSKWSDGRDKIEDIVISAKRFGYEYIAITDHSQGLKVARGLSVADVHKKLEQIKDLNKKVKGIRILSGTEVDIHKDGSLDYDDDVLKRFDVVIAAIHSGFRETKAKLTDRILWAIDNKNVNIIAHPTGRLMGMRGPYEIDLERILRAAKDAGVAMEINSYPDRLDLNDINSRVSAVAGVKLALGTDSHSREQLEYMRFGVSVARRAWLNKQDVVNTVNLDGLLKFLDK